MKRVIVVGGGWAGCAAALAAVKAGAETVLLEKTDLLLGTGLVGGIMRNNGRFTAAEEMIALGGGELFQVCDRVSTHTNVDFPGHRHATLYNVTLIEPEVRQLLVRAGVKIMFRTRVTGIALEARRIRAIQIKGSGAVQGDVFIDTTGSAGPPGNCTKYGEGCMMCVLRCPTFGGRVSIAGLCGVKELQSVSHEGRVGAYSGSCKLAKESLAPAVQKELEERGVVVLPIPEELQDRAKLDAKACQQYADRAFAENAVILDTGHAKLMSPYIPLETLRSIPGLEKTRYIDPYSGGMGNSVRYLAMAPHDEALKVEGVENLYCAGEKAGPLVGHTEAIVSGTLAGFNAAMASAGQSDLTLPTELAVGDVIARITEAGRTPGGWNGKYTFSGSFYFRRMVELGLYTTDTAAIRDRVRTAQVEGLFGGSPASRRMVV